MSHRDRFRLKSQLYEQFMSPDWDFPRLKLLLNEFGHGGHADFFEDLHLTDALAAIDDFELAEMYATVMGVDLEEVEKVVESSPNDGNWKDGYIRLFLSHSAVHKRFAASVADELAVVGIHAFVAHDTMAYSKPWQAQIEQALRSMQAFVALVHSESVDSAWCNQEVGWALGRRVPRFAVRLGADPKGFLGSDQWPSSSGAEPKEVSRVISSWVYDLPELGSYIIDGLLSALESAGNYMTAGSTAERIAALGSLSDGDFERLDRVWWSNDQLYTGYLPSKALEPLYRQNGRPWPPPRTS